MTIQIETARSLCLATILACALCTTALAQTPAPRAQPPVVSLIKIVADGQPWSMTTSDGRSVRITLNPGGGGRMEAGPMSLTPAWRESKEGQLCIKPNAMMGERCSTLKREAQAIVGIDGDGKVGFRLMRP